MNVFILSTKQEILMKLEKALAGSCRVFAATNLTELHEKVSRTEPDGAFIDESLFSQHDIRMIHDHLLKKGIDVPMTSTSAPFDILELASSSKDELARIAGIIHNASVASEHDMNLSPKLSMLLNFFMSHMGESIETRTLMHHLWDEVTDGHIKTLYTYICLLREKLAERRSMYTIRRDSKGCYTFLEKA